MLYHKPVKQNYEPPNPPKKPKFKSKKEEAEWKLKEYYRLLGIKNPDTGVAYSIPLLLETDPDYSHKYVEYMRLREENPRLFEKILNWD